MGGLSPERDVSLTTGQAVFAAIQRNGLDAVALDVRDNGVAGDIEPALGVERNGFALGRGADFFYEIKG